ncbi:uncharacterized protein [Rutidosis leptorrhynchoides]|uniref:uncharacterized protein n=1 Tax=Rutidosis leptorrhynchoides TaxID=125765 RepID=UPI003A9A3856
MAGDEESFGVTKIENAPDVNSPFYIHASDHPQQMHVNETLIDNNYIVPRDVEFSLCQKQSGFIDGSIKKPDQGSSTYMLWMRCDVMVKGWLITAMEKDIKTSVKYANAASEIWSDLKEWFGKESAPRAYELKQKLSLTHQDGSTVSVYYTKLRALWDEIDSMLSVPKCTCGLCTIKDKERLYEFFMGLDSQFSVIITQILAMNPVLNLRNAYHLVAEDERQRAISTDKRSGDEVAAFKASSHMRREGNRQQKRDSSFSKYTKKIETTESYTHCGKKGHTRDRCFKRIGYPEWWPGNKKKEEAKPKVAFAESKNHSPIPGLTKEQYDTLQALFECRNVCRFSKDLKCALTFFPDFCVMQKLYMRNLIVAGECKEGLYIGSKKKDMTTTIDIWHKRLGHASSDKLTHIDFLNNSLFNKSCDSCSKAKHTRLPFSSSSIKSNECFEVIHCEI